MKFTFDSPVSIGSTAYDKGHRWQPASPAVLSSKSRRKSTISNSFLTNLIHRGSRAVSSTQVSDARPLNATPAAKSLFFRLPLTLRQKIYGYIVGQHEVLHVLMKHKAAHFQQCLAYRRCRAGGNIEDCVVEKCREFRDIAGGVYFGSFDRIGGLLSTCRDIHQEASLVLYQQNALDFDHPSSFIVFSHQISQASLQCIRSISFELQRHHYVQKSGNHTDLATVCCKPFRPDEWIQMWDIIAKMEGLEEVRVKFWTPFHGWMGWKEKDVLEPPWKITRPLRAFDIQAPWFTIEAYSEIEAMGRRRPFRLLRLT